MAEQRHNFVENKRTGDAVLAPSMLPERHIELETDLYITLRPTVDHVEQRRSF